MLNIVLLVSFLNFCNAEESFFSKSAQVVAQAVSDADSSSNGATTALLVINWLLGVALLVGMLYYYNKESPEILDCCTITSVVVLWMFFGLLGLLCGFCLLKSRHDAVQGSKKYGSGKGKV